MSAADPLARVAHLRKAIERAIDRMMDPEVSQELREVLAADEKRGKRKAPEAKPISTYDRLDVRNRGRVAPEPPALKCSACGAFGGALVPDVPPDPLEDEIP